MKKIVNGLLYDTEKSDIIYVDMIKNRSIYKTIHGAYFTLYSNGQIIPTTEENVKDFLGKTDIDKYIEFFGVPKEA